MTSQWKYTISLLLAVVAAIQGQDCEQKTFSAESFVCVCNSDHCDYAGPILPPTEEGVYFVVSSSRDSDRLKVGETGSFFDEPLADSSVVHLAAHYEYQEIIGFGGAFTDSTGYNLEFLSDEVKDHFVKSHFSPEGIEYDLCRIPIAGSDFSVRPYSYDDVDGDVALEHFALTDEDLKWKLPYIVKGIEYSTREIRLFGSPWAPPAWMKESGMANGTGSIKREMWQPYADYFVKFVEAYEAAGAPMWGLTTQNEPLTGYEDWAWNTCLWTPEDTRDWVASTLGPTLEANDMRRLKLMILDHNRDALPWYPAVSLENPEANKYVDGIAVHWYADEWVGPGILSETADMFRDKFMLYTEACVGWAADPDSRVILGSWSRAEEYADNIIDGLTHDQGGWVDWNMALDMSGGPNWANNFVDAPIIVNKDTDEFYKQPTFYAMGHFSKFLEPGSKRVYTGVSGNYENIKATAVHNPDGHYTAVILNKDENAQKISLETGTGQYMHLEVEPKSLHTVVFRV